MSSELQPAKVRLRVFYFTRFRNLLNFNIMSNVQIIFKDVADGTTLECYYDNDIISICISPPHRNNTFTIDLDVPTAIKLSKVLRTEIAKAKKEGVNHD